MVGVLRSKACNACRARRKKCDEERPACGACLKRGAACVYRKDINFVFYQPPEADSPDLPEDLDPNVNQDTEDSSTSFELSDRNSRSLTRNTTPFNFAEDYITPIDLPQALIQSAQASCAHGYFLDEYLPRSYKSIELNSFTGNPAAAAWIRRFGYLASSDPLLNDALLALSLKRAEQVYNSPDIAMQGVMVYSRVIKNISFRLSNPVDSMSDSTLAAVMALTTWETQSATGRGAQGWLAHVKGALQLVGLRGSKNFTSEFGKELYLGSLLSNLIGAIGARKALPFATPPDGKIFGDFASYAKLFQILHGLPAILEQSDIVTNAADAKASHAEMVKQSSIMTYLIRDFESRLTEWTAQLEESPDDPLFWQEPSFLAARLPADSPDRIFTYFNCFRSLDLGHQLVFGWACHLLANLALMTNVKAMKDNGYNDIKSYATDFDMMNIFRRLYKLSIDILVSFEYFLHPDMGQTAIDFLGLPVNLVYGFMLNKEFPERRWFRVLFDRMRELNPGFGDFLESMAKQGGGGRAFKMLVQKAEEMPSMKHAYSDTSEIIL